MECVFTTANVVFAETTTEAAPVASDATTDAPVSHTPDVEVEIETVSVSKDESKPIVNENGDSQTSVDSGNNAQAAHHTLSNGHVDAPKSSYASTLVSFCLFLFMLDMAY